MDLLLDETICAGTVAVPREMVRLAGGVNKRLGAKQKYELLLRIAAETPVEFAETGEDACGHALAIRASGLSLEEYLALEQTK